MRLTKRRQATSTVIGLGLLAVMLFPVYWMVLTTFQPAQDSITYPPDLLPHGIQFGTITSLFDDNPIASWLLHSLTASAICVAVTLFFAVPGNGRSRPGAACCPAGVATDASFSTFRLTIRSCPRKLRSRGRACSLAKCNLYFT